MNWTRVISKNSKGLTIDYAYQWSYGKGEILTILIPDAKGGGSSDQRYEKNAKNRIAYAQSNQPTRQNDPNINQVLNQYVQASYWGEQPFTAGTVYFGAIIIFLATLGFILIIKWSFVYEPGINVAKNLLYSTLRLRRA